MRSILKNLLFLAPLSVAGNIGFADLQSPPTFFRSDGGIARTNGGPLPDRFDAPTKLRWRTRVDSGQSTPIVSNGRIFLTTYRTADRELATMAIDEDSGKVLWKQKAPAERIEQLHATMGSPAAATPACDGVRVFVFFGSYGLICYDLEGRKLCGQFAHARGGQGHPLRRS
jgi:outer membrane protein assembly factor BamB